LSVTGAKGQITRCHVRSGSNPQMDRLRYSADVHVSMDDEEMREVDPDEHREALGAGIPQHLGQYLSKFLFLILLHNSA